MTTRIKSGTGRASRSGPATRPIIHPLRASVLAGGTPAHGAQTASPRTESEGPVIIAVDAMPEFAAPLPGARAALEYARRLHEGQRRTVDGAPFITHPIEVGKLLYEAGATDAVIAAGVLHDTLEKTNATAYELRSRFGRTVGQIVCAVSHDPGIAGYSRRKAALRDQVARAGEDALSVFAADKLSKVRELRLDESSGAIKVRNRRLRHYRLSLAMLQERLPDSPLVAALETELDALSNDGALVVRNASEVRT